MSNFDETESMIQAISANLKNTVFRARERLEELTNLGDAFEDIDTAFEEVVNALDAMNERIAKLERRTADL